MGGGCRQWNDDGRKHFLKHLFESCKYPICVFLRVLRAYHFSADNADYHTNLCKTKGLFFYAHGHRDALPAGAWHQDAGADGSKINKNMLFSAFFIHFFAIFAV